MIRTEQQARDDLHDYFPQLHAIVRRAVADFLKDYGHLRADQTKRTEASIIHDLMAKHARMQFDEEPGVKVSLKNNLFLVHFGGKYSIKLKKLINGKPANNVTQTVIEFRNQPTQRTIPGVEPSPTNLYLGYERSEDLVELTDVPVWLVCPRGNGIAWAICLDDEVGVATTVDRRADVVPFAEERVARARVRSIPTNVEDEAEDQQG